MQIPALDTPNQQLIRSKELNDCVCNAFEHFWKTNKYNDIGGQFLMSLDKVVKEEDELRDLNSQLKCCTNDPKASLCAFMRPLEMQS